MKLRGIMNEPNVERPGLPEVDEFMDAPHHAHEIATEVIESLEAQLLASIAENRQKDAEVARQKAIIDEFIWGEGETATETIGRLQAEIGRLTEALTRKTTARTDWIRKNEAELLMLPAKETRIKTLEAELAELRSLGGERWIECKQELPPYRKFTPGIGWGNQVYVLAIDDKGRMAVAWFQDHSCGTPQMVSAKPIGFPTHWMPLPAPPTREKE